MVFVVKIWKMLDMCLLGMSGSNVYGLSWSYIWSMLWGKCLGGNGCRMISLILIRKLLVFACMACEVYGGRVLTSSSAKGPWIWGFCRSESEERSNRISRSMPDGGIRLNWAAS